MLIEILLIILYAVLSLPVVPIFCPSSFFRKEENDDDNNETHVSWLYVIFYSLLILVFSVLISGLIFSQFNYGRRIWYVYLFPAFYPIFWNFCYFAIMLKKKIQIIVFPILAISLVGVVLLPIRDLALPYKDGTLKEEVAIINAENMEEEEELPKTKPFLSVEEIKLRFGATEITNLYYSNGKNIYVLQDEVKNFGVAIVDDVTAKFIPCKHKNEISGVVRKRYKTQEIVKMGIVLNDDIPYAKYGIIKRPTMFSQPIVDYYLLLNMVEEDVEITSYKQDELPVYARN